MSQEMMPGQGMGTAHEKQAVQGMGAAREKETGAGLDVAHEKETGAGLDAAHEKETGPGRGAMQEKERRYGTGMSEQMKTGQVMETRNVMPVMPETRQAIPATSKAAGRNLVPEQWVANYADLLFSYAYQRIADTAAAEDIVQETFLSAWRSRNTYDQISSEKTWLFAICKNKIIDHYRKLKSARISLGLTNSGRDAAYSDSHYFDEKDHWTIGAQPTLWTMSDPDQVNKEFLTILNHCRSKLNKMQHSVFTMRYLDDIDAKEVCRLAGITVQNYWVLIHRAKLQLRECLQKNWMDV